MIKGDFVKGLANSPYSITTAEMTRGLVTEVHSDTGIEIKVLDHENACHIGGKHSVDPKFFVVIGHVKEFNREEVIELLKNGCMKAILDYDLRDANLSGANLDYSCWPLWCGSLHVKTDKRIACQLAYHLCSMQCDDADYIAMRNSILDFANQFHRVGECGTLQVIDTTEV